MDPFSFLNAVHPSYLADLYQKYLVNPDAVEPSWRAFFQGFDFGQIGTDATEVMLQDTETKEKHQVEKVILEIVSFGGTCDHTFDQI